MRRQAEQALHRTQDDLEVLVAQRTAELARVNESLQRAETYLAEAQRLSLTGSFGWKVANGEIYWSQETFRIFETNPTAKPTVELILQQTHPEDRAIVRQIVDRVSRERKDFDFEHRLLMPDGSVKYVRVVGHPSIDKSGNFEFVGAVTDVTERKQAEEEHQAHLWFLESMDQVNRAIQGTNDLEQMMSDVLDAMLAIFNCDRAWLVYPCDPEALRGKWRWSMFDPNFPVPSPWDSICRWSRTSRRYFKPSERPAALCDLVRHRSIRCRPKRRSVSAYSLSSPWQFIPRRTSPTC